MSYNTFHYSPLDAYSHEFRLLKKMRHMPDRQNYTMETHIIAEAPQFSAFSYTWGKDLPSRRIIIDSAPFYVRENLWQALEETWDDDRVYTYIWVDAICINQNSFLERNHQVDLMSNIFSASSRTIAWVGVGTADSELAMNFFKGFGKEGSTNKRGRRHVEEVKEAITSFFCRPYFERMWIVQEILLSERVMVKCGSLYCSWRTIKLLMTRRSNGGILSRAPYFLLRFHYREDYSLYTLLEFFEANKCEDPRDKVFALLSLVDRDPRMPKPFRANYDMSDGDVWVQTFAYVEDCQSVKPEPGYSRDNLISLLNRALGAYDHVLLNTGVVFPLRDRSDAIGPTQFIDG
ncbi:heterokaryon incompatibility protein-domain-containing protein [Pestalotiopsis sp. NC0098]|nr:heterokaryon incompatibility protein-domain-containing protein [Pestalotiopsis sp. NC0098]